MTYAVRSLIQSTDFNNLVGGSTANVSGQLNSVWSTGNGNTGYGQTAVANVSLSTKVAATDWASLINKLNNVRQHQSNVSAGLSAPTAGTLTSYLSTLNSTLTTAYTSRLSAFTNGTTITGSTNTWNPTAGTESSLSAFVDCNITFASANAARYFFNAGGKINFVCSATDAASTTRSQSLRDAVNALGGMSNFASYTNSGRSGTGGTISTNTTAWGYWLNVYNSATTVIQSDDTNSSYSGYNAKLQCFSSSNDTTNGANGLSLVFRLLLTASADDAFGGDINLTVSTRADIIPPETTNLTNVWGTPTITFDNA